MQRTVTTLEVRERLGDLLDRVALRYDEFVIERRGKPMAALVPLSTLEKMRSAALKTIVDFMERQPGGLSEVEADALADEAKHRTRPRPRTKARRGR